MGTSGNGTGGGFFDYELRVQAVKEKERPLDRLNAIIPWDLFRGELEAVFTSVPPKGPGGRPPFDRLLMFKVLVLQRYYNLSDAETEYQLKDRLSFQDFVGIRGSDRVPDEKTIWLFRESLGGGDGVARLFRLFDGFLSREGVVAREGVIVDASFVNAPKQRNSRGENKRIKEGEVPEEWNDNPNKLRQKDVDARWAIKERKLYYGYKNHIKVDTSSKLILSCEVTPANVHDSRVLVTLLDDRDRVIHGDRAYNDKAVEEHLSSLGIESRIHEKASRTGPLTDSQKEDNRVKSKTRARVEHVFGFMRNSMADHIHRYIGIKRADTATRLKNLVYNLFRYEQIMRLGNNSSQNRQVAGGI